MCGIFGLFQPSLKKQEREQLTKTLANQISHRGPDNFGLWSARNGLTLAHQRLSILELNARGNQPIISADKRWVLSYNGEIYNFPSIHKNLDAVNFEGQSDSRILIEAIAQWGLDETVTKLRGMFAFALWDDEKQELHLVRDRIGEKPLYYGWFKDTFFFTSELKSIYAHPDWQPTLDFQSLSSYFKYNCVPYAQSIFTQTYQLPPGHILTLSDLKDSSPPASRTYWALNNCFQSKPQKMDNAEAQLLVEDKLSEVLKLQMRSDVPLGAFLSGGVDSSLIVALMQQVSSTPIQTFTIGFSDSLHDESQNAKAIAKHLGTQHTELILNGSEALDLIPQLASIYDEPFADSSQIPTYLVSKMTRESVTVALSGDGGDELFSGYTRYLWLEKIWQNSQKFPSWLKEMGHSSIHALSESNWNRIHDVCKILIPNKYRQNDLGQKLYKLDGLINQPDYRKMYESIIGFWEHGMLLDPAIDLPPLVTPADSKNRSLVEYIMALDTLNFLPNDILTKVDRASMAVSLEGRMPFLDHELIELVWSLPQSLKIHDGVGKQLARSILYKHVPKNLIERPKQGFAIPIDQWLRTDLNTWAEDLLCDSMLKKHPWLNPRPLRKRWEEHKKGHRNWGTCLWNFLMFQSWHQRWL